MEYLPLARALAIGRPYALGTILLASLYQSMGKYVSEIPYQRVGGALWFVQIWLFANFPRLPGVDSFPPCLWVLVRLNPLGLYLQPSFFIFSLSWKTVLCLNYT